MINRLKTRMMRWAKGQMLKRMHRMITCREFEDFVQQYLDEELPSPQLAMFELHLRICRECRDYLAAYRRSLEIGRAVFKADDESLPEDVPEDLIKAILEAREL
jgi:predicted anti-sigma-YlaC factor YlaD